MVDDPRDAEKTRWAQVKEIVADALDIDHPERRARLIAERCGGDTELRAEVESLVETGSLGVASKLDAGAAKLLEKPIPEAGERVGRYALRAVIGEGGMGRVYEAVQESPHRTVALKILRPGLVAHDAERRFAWEIEALGRLSHPGIAGVLEAGVAELDGGARVPWFAMERVEGRPLLSAADALGLDRNARLDLFLRTADAVGHAHQRGVIHRDLKPDNILVDDSGHPHVLDFGIARVADPAATAMTTAGEIVGTLAYMSPEQVLGQPDRVDARTDVYALGVLLYRLLLGRPPLELDGLPLPKVALRLSSEDPRPAGEIDRTLKGDLETILRTALERDPERRYGTVDAFAADIRRWRNDEPIAARPPTAWYQLSKFASRNLGLVAGVGLAFTSAILAAVISSVQYVRASEARARAEVERDRALDARDFMRTIFTSARPDLLGRDVRVVDLLEDASAELESRDDLERQVAALLHFVLGDTLRWLGSQELAASHLERAADGYALDAGDELEELEARAALAEVLLDLGAVEAADAEIARVSEGRRASGASPPWLEIRPAELRAARAGIVGDTELQVEESRAVFERWLDFEAPGHETVESARSNLSNALLYAGEYREAEELLAAGIQAMNGTDEEGGARQLTQIGNRAVALLSLGELKEAEALTEKIAPIASDVWGPAHPKTLAALNTRADVLRQRGRGEESLALYGELLRISEETFGPAHFESVVARNNYAVALLYEERPDEALRVVEAALRSIEDEFEVANPVQVLQLRMTLANAYSAADRLGDAVDLTRTIVTTLEQIAGPAHPQTLISRNNLAVMLMNLGRTEQAIAVGRRNMEVARNDDPGLRMIQFPMRSNLGRALTAAERYGEAVQELEAVHAFLETDPNTSEAETLRIRELLAEAFEAWGKPREASLWRDQ